MQALSPLYHCTMSNQQPNLIVVITDDQGYGDLGCTGNPWVKTPHIDAFHDASLRFTDFHVQPLCTPTRGALMTGRRPIRKGAWATCWGRSILRLGEQTMANYFQSAGYRTSIFGKWHLGDNFPYRPMDRGFEIATTHRGGGVGQTPDHWGNNYFDDTYDHNGEARSHLGYCTDIWFEEAIKEIDRDDQRPFFTVIATNAPHSPYLVEDRYADPYRGDVTEERACFLGMISNIDENFGRLREHLQTRGIDHNTVVIFMTDNGTSGGCNIDSEGFLTDGYNAGMRGMKASYHEGGHRVPFFLHWPGGELGEARDLSATALDVDVLPTLLDLCGLPPSTQALDGRSFIPSIRGEEQEERTRFLHVLQSFDTPKAWECCVMRGPWRLVGHDELYHIGRDLEQRNNVIAQHTNIAKSLRSANQRWWQEAQAHFGEVCHIHLGDESKNPTTLVCMDVMGDVAWQQPHIAEAAKTSGFWNVDFVQEGRYRISLRRWPEELDLPIDGVITQENAEALAYGSKERGVVQIQPDSASLSFGDQRHQQDIAGGDRRVDFEVDVEAGGPTRLEAWFLQSGEPLTSAYYVEVERLRPLG